MSNEIYDTTANKEKTRTTEPTQTTQATETTETIDPRYGDLDQQPTSTVLDYLFESQLNATQSVAKCLPELTRAVDNAAKRLANGNGRLIMVGAGASGRLAVQDGAELWPTYGWPAERLVLQIAGGEAALTKSMDGAEDDYLDASKRIEEIQFTPADVVVAVSASGYTPWTCTWIVDARRDGALSIGIANNEYAPLIRTADFGLFLDSGAEVLAGSTRMASGTAQKVLLNLFSTALMVRLNRTHGNLMVDMAAVNSKLDTRRIKMLETIVGKLNETDAKKALTEANGNVKLAALLTCGLSVDEATMLLESVNGSLRQALQKASSFSRAD